MTENIFQILGMFLLALVPILGWIYFFQKQHHTQKKYVTLTFLAGMCSVIPIKLYEKYWDTALWKFEHLNLFQSLGDLVENPSLATLLAYTSLNIIVAAGLFIFIAIMMLCFEVISGDNSLQVFKKKSKKILESPLFFVSVGSFCGLVAFFSTLSTNEKIWFFIIVGLLEEFVKHLILRFSDEEKIYSVKDALSFSILIALGFAFVENIIYFKNIFNNETLSLKEFGYLILLRSTISVAAHVSFSAIFGYFYGVAKFAPQIYQQETQENKHKVIEKLHQILHLKGSTLFHEEKMMEGLILAMICHAIFNSLLEFGVVSLIIPLIGSLLFLIVHLFNKKDYPLYYSS